MFPIAGVHCQSTLHSTAAILNLDFGLHFAQKMQNVQCTICSEKLHFDYVLEVRESALSLICDTRDGKPVIF